MKTIQFIILILSGFVIANGISQPVDKTLAENAAISKIQIMGYSDNYKVDSIPEVFYSQSDDPLFFVFQLKPVGYVIVIADKRLPPIIAYSFSNHYKIEGKENNPLTDLVTQDITNRMANIKLLDEKIKDKRKMEWEVILTDNEIGYDNIKFEQWPPDGTTTTGGWLETNWSQGAPYNNFCPMDLITNQRSIAGCPSIAIAMIINYYKTLNGTEFNDEVDDYYHSYAGRNYWIDDEFEDLGFLPFPDVNAYFDTISTSFANHTTLKTNETAALIWASGIAAKQVYTSNISGTFGVEQAYGAFLRFGYQDAILLNGNDTTIHTHLAQNMKLARPSLLAVIDPGIAGHNLVTDGYNTDGYYHLNFGWGGSYNGWYLIPDEIPYNLSVFEGVIVDIAYPPVYTFADQKNTKPSSVVIYPNPVSEKINIEYHIDCSSDLLLELRNIKGKSCYKKNVTRLNVDQDTFSFTIDNEIISQLSPGVYFLSISSENNSITKKVIVN